MTGHGERLAVTITDDGIGFDVNAVQGGGLGLVSMRERVDALGGDLRTGPTGDGGFTVVAALPLTSTARDVVDA